MLRPLSCKLRSYALEACDAAERPSDAAEVSGLAGPAFLSMAV